MIFASYAQIISTFDTDRDGWTAIDNQSGPNPSYQATGGNPTGESFRHSQETINEVGTIKTQ